MRLNRRIGVALIVVAAAVLLPNAALGLSQTVTIRGFAFLPAGATIAPGESITWSNADGTTHTATSNTPGAFDTGPIAMGATKMVTLANAGTYAYHCSIHPSMTGTITVQAPQPTPVPTVPPTPVPTAPPPPTSAPPTPVPTVPATPAPTATAVASSAGTPSAPSASPIPSAAPSAVGTARPSLLTLASPSPAPAAPAIGDGPGSLLAVGAVTAAAALAGLAFYLYRRR